MNIIIEENKNYNDIDNVIKDKIKNEKLPLVCLTGLAIEHPLDFIYVVYDKHNDIKGKFIQLKDAIEYAEFLSKKHYSLHK